MKLKNKKTGEIREVKEILIDGMFNVKSLAELNEEWGDVDEPKECKYWYIDVDDDDVYQTDDKKWLNDRNRELIGNYFTTKEEAEKAVEKLKAWKRLKDKGFSFGGWEDCNGEINTIYFSIPENKWETDTCDDLDICFGGEDD